MKRKKILIGVLGAVLIICSVTIPVIAWAAENNKKAQESLYTKPSIGEIVRDGEYPDEIKSSSSALAKEKEWYEYITYSKTSIGEVDVSTSKKEKKRAVFYDPYDYSYGMTMEVSDVQSQIDKSTISEFTTANLLGISYSHSASITTTHSDGISASIKAGLSVEGFGLKSSLESSLGATINDGKNEQTSDSETRSMTFNAIYFNGNGTPYAWKVVHYTVTLPLYCEIQTYINGNWVTTDTDYLLLTTVQGTCREYIKNEVVYIEHWGTGEPVTVDDFWDGFFSKENLKKAYQNKLLPNN